MNMKDTAILLIFLLSVLGLIIGVYCADDLDSYELDSDDSDIIDNSMEPESGSNLSEFFTDNLNDTNNFLD